ncbi:endo-1,4-beta-xylanase [Balneolales bacterium ANBcel1]|nr:endo-1,4-beta-xylanase [Balneolales bacterium ANBcel1]
MHKQLLPFLALSLFLATACQTEQTGNADLVLDPPLYEVYEDAFLLGTILNRAQIYADGGEIPTDTVRKARRGYFIEGQIIPQHEGLELGVHHFNQVTAENVMKWEEIHPEPGVYDFDAADRLVDLAEAAGMHITGHTLVWHSQTPNWVFEDENGDPISRDALIERMRDHIHTVAGRYAGRVHSWDVVNEAVSEDGTLRESRWYEIIGEEYLVKAFRFAHEADPEARLFYNDYNMETNPVKRQGAIDLVQYVMDSGAPVHGIGSQSHLNLLDFPDLEDVRQTIIDFAELGIDVAVTELDITVLPSPRSENPDPYVDGLPQEVAEEQAQRYRELFEVYLDHSDVITRVTFWGHMDHSHWLNYLPYERVNHPVLFDRDNQAKPAFQAVYELGAERTR